MSKGIRILAVLCVPSMDLCGQGLYSGGVGDGYAANGFAQIISTAGVFNGGNGDGYATAGTAQPISTTGPFAGGAGDGYARQGFAQPISSPGIFNGGSGDGYARNSAVNVHASVQAMALLEGPWNTGTQLMNDNLRVAGLIPLVEPYTALGYPQAGGGGGELTSLTTISNVGAIDWVRAELRDGSDPSVLIAVRHALLQPSGYLIDPFTGDDFIQFDALPGNYYLAIRHRNHLGVMTGVPVLLSSGPAVQLSFTTTASSTYGTEAEQSVGNFKCLWPGNAKWTNGTQQIKYVGANNDRDVVLTRVGGATPTGIAAGYLIEDINLDGVVKYTGTSNDRDIILQTIGGTTPNAVRLEQVP